MSEASVAALIVTYNRRELLERCLEAVFGQDYQVAQIVVIDNASTDGTEELFEEGGQFAGKVLYRRMKKNLGGAGGFKEGLRTASRLGCGWVWLMDDDCIARSDTLSKLVEAAGRLDGPVSFLASSVFGPAGEPMNVPVVDTSPSANGYPDWYRTLSDGLVCIQSATFVSLLISCDAIKKIGLPIGSFFIWGDDSEYTKRLTRYYGSAYMVGSSRILHARVGAKALRLETEDDRTRIKNFRHFIRNNLVVERCYAGKARALCRCVGRIATFPKYLLSGGPLRLRLLRAGAVLKGSAEYLLHRYDLEDLGKLCD